MVESVPSALMTILDEDLQPLGTGCLVHPLLVLVDTPLREALAAKPAPPLLVSPASASEASVGEARAVVIGVREVRLATEEGRAPIVALALDCETGAIPAPPPALAGALDARSQQMDFCEAYLSPTTPLLEDRHTLAVGEPDVESRTFWCSGKLFPPPWWCMPVDPGGTELPVAGPG
jgi:hypothetical protein